MKNKLFPFAGSLFFLMLLWLSMSACSGKRPAEKAARAFLQAYYVDLDFNVARALSTPASHAAIAEKEEMASLNPYAKEEAPSISFKELRIEDRRSGKALCTYWANRVEKTLELRKVEGQWKADLQAQAQEEAAGMYSLSSDNSQGGFASAASGPVVYKKRRPVSESGQ